MDTIERWKLADELTVYQIALLIAGYDPAEFVRDYHDQWPEHIRQDISPYLSAVKNAARSGRLSLTAVKYENTYASDDTDWAESTVNIDSLCDWLKARNFHDGFFVSTAGQVEKIADQSNEFHAPKLAAAVRAWTEVTADPEACNGKSPKKALEIWLRKNANEYGLTSKDGSPNELGIEEICKVANWKLAGGASPTPVPALSRFASPMSDKGNTGWVRKVRRNSPTPQPKLASMEIDDDIPF
jgi:hypothetical protein